MKVTVAGGADEEYYRGLSRVQRVGTVNTNKAYNIE
jgi:hypothetical protein